MESLNSIADRLLIWVIGQYAAHYSAGLSRIDAVKVPAELADVGSIRQVAASFLRLCPHLSIRFSIPALPHTLLDANSKPVCYLSVEPNYKPHSKTTPWWLYSV